MFKVSAVVCTRNRGSRIVATLDTLLANSHPNFEVIVLDQSTDGVTAEAVEPYKQDPRFRHLPSSSKGTGWARDLGLRAARGAVVAYTDDDCIVPANWLEEIEKIFDQNPKVAVAFCNVRPAPYDATAGFIPAYERTNDQIVRNMWDKCRARGIGAGMAVRREPALKIGGFDHRLGPGSRFSDCEDGDIAMRALIAGWWLYESAQVAVVHDGFRTWEEGKAMAQRNWIGIGAAYAKPIKCGHWRAATVVLYEAFVVALGKPLSRLVRLRKPQGIRSFYYFWKGFALGLTQTVNKDTIKFSDNSDSLEAQHG
ncbi:MAG: glycosyltransferase family 2 protein [Hyphomicrobiaceae bacterium]